jgi:hypothetical protein
MFSALAGEAAVVFRCAARVAGRAVRTTIRPICYREIGLMLTIRPAQPQDGSMRDERLRELVQQLNKAENEHLNEEGPLRMRLHQAIVALCDYAGVANKWATEP